MNSNKGYAILSSKYIDVENNKNWHVFEANSDLKSYSSKLDIYIESKSECKLDVKKITKDVYKKPFFHYLIDDNGIIEDTYVEGFYYTDKDNTVYFSNNESIIRMLIAILGRSVCGTCASSLYKDENKNKDD